jgi:hypothetical protein
VPVINRAIFDPGATAVTTPIEVGNLEISASVSIEVELQ